jgi:hypothetical protein
MDATPLNGSRWQLAAAGILLAVWTLFLLMMAILG